MIYLRHDLLYVLLALRLADDGRILLVGHGDVVDRRDAAHHQRLRLQVLLDRVEDELNPAVL